MMLPYVAWIAIWQVMYDPRLWIGAGSSPYAVPEFGECRLN